MIIVILIHTESYLLWSQKRSVLSNWWQLNFCFCNFNYRNISQTIWRNPSLRLDKYIWPLWPGKPSGDQVSIEYRVGGSANPGPAPRPHLTCWQLGDILAATAIDRFLLDLPSWELWVEYWLNPTYCWNPSRTDISLVVIPFLVGPMRKIIREKGDNIRIQPLAHPFGPFCK